MNWLDVAALYYLFYSPIWSWATPVLGNQRFSRHDWKKKEVFLLKKYLPTLDVCLIQTAHLKQPDSGYEYVPSRKFLHLCHRFSIQPAYAWRVLFSVIQWGKQLLKTKSESRTSGAFHWQLWESEENFILQILQNMLELINLLDRPFFFFLFRQPKMWQRKKFSVSWYAAERLSSCQSVRSATSWAEITARVRQSHRVNRCWPSTGLSAGNRARLASHASL